MFNIIKIEANALQAFKEWKKNNNENTREDLFSTLYKLCYAIVTLSYKNVDQKRTAYEMALDLFIQIINGKLNLTHERKFPLTVYIRKIIRYFLIHEGDEHDLFDKVSDYIGKIHHDETNDQTYNLPSKEPSLEWYFDKTQADRKVFVISDKIMDALRLFYKESEIIRLMPLSLHLIRHVSFKYIFMNIPLDIKDFITVLIAISKRLMDDYNIRYHSYSSEKKIKKLLNSGLRSTLYMSLIMNKKVFPTGLAMAVDFETFYRLSRLFGGTRIRIPTLGELDRVAEFVNTLGSAIEANKPVSEIMTDLNNKFPYFPLKEWEMPIEQLTAKLIDSVSIFSENPDKISQSFFEMLLNSVNTMNLLFSELKERMEDTTNMQMLNIYNDLSDSMTKLMQTFIAIDQSLKKKT